MAEKHLGDTIDIHAGGQDLVFPHHENECAQSRCAHGGAPFARYWLHNGFLSVDETKMSKSLGNVLLVHDLVETIPGEVIRLALLNAHYRQPLEWSAEAIESARRMLDRLYGAVRGIDVSDEARKAADAPEALVASLEEDLNSPKALAEKADLGESAQIAPLPKNAAANVGSRSRTMRSKPLRCKLAASLPPTLPRPMKPILISRLLSVLRRLAETKLPECVGFFVRLQGATATA